MWVHAGGKEFKLSLALWPQTGQSQFKSGAPRISAMTRLRLADLRADSLHRQPDPETDPVDHLHDRGKAEAEAEAKQPANLNRD